MQAGEVSRIGSRGGDDIDEFLWMDGLLIDSGAGSAHALDWRSSHDLISRQKKRKTCKRRDKASVKAAASNLNLIYKEK